MASKPTSVCEGPIYDPEIWSLTSIKCCDDLGKVDYHWLIILHRYFTVRQLGKQNEQIKTNLWITILVCTTGCLLLTRWGRLWQWTGSSLVQIMACRATVWINADILLIAPWGTYFNEILFEIRKFSFTNMHLKMTPTKRRPSPPPPPPTYTHTHRRHRTMPRYDIEYGKSLLYTDYSIKQS